MQDLRLKVLSLRYSSWSIRPWLALTHSGATFVTETAPLAEMTTSSTRRETPTSTSADALAARRRLGSVTGLFPVLWADGTPIHEALAICEWAAESFPQAGLWPDNAMDRAQARSISTEMATGFPNMRTHLSCHVFARVPAFSPNEATRAEIERVFEIWRACLERSGGPFLFGRFGIADCMYFPVVTRFATYGVAMTDELHAYERALYELPAVQAWRALALESPRYPAYDAYVEGLGGNPIAIDH